MGLTGASWVCLVMGVTVYARTVCRGIRTVCRCGNDDGSGMALISSGVRVGAAAFVVGLSLAGPQALGVAAADSSDASSVSSDARNTGAGRAGSVERSAAARSVRRAGLGGAARASAAASVAESAGRTDGRSAPGLVQGRRVNTRSVATPGVVTGGVTSAAVNVSSDAGVGGRLFGGPVANAATSAAPAAATAASTRRSVTKKPTAFSPVDLNPVATANAQINSAFDALANQLSGLPQGPVADFLGGALLIVRRTLFNQAPTAAPAEYVQNSTAILGTIGASDVEGDRIVYTVVEAPTYAAIDITEDGDWTYTPLGFDSVGGTDSFTVRVTDTGPHLHLLGPSATTIVVPVTIAGVQNAISLTNRFSVRNNTSKPLYYRRLESGELENGGPQVGTEVQPGDYFDFEVVKRYWSSNNVRVAFGSANDADWYAVTLNAPPVVDPTRVNSTSGCYASGGNKCSTYSNLPIATFLDPSDTVIVVDASEKEKQTELLNKFVSNNCYKAESCTYENTAIVDLVPDPNGKQLGSAAENKSDGTSSKQFGYSFTESATTAWEIAAQAKGTLFKLVEVQLAAKTSKSWTSSATVSENSQQSVLPWSYSALFASPYLSRVTGDFTIKYGNTTWKLKDVVYTFPNAGKCEGNACKGLVIFVSQPLEGGFDIKDPKSSLVAPVYTAGDPPQQLKVTAYNGLADFTTRVTYTSTQPSVATVSSTGAITPLTAGTTDIIATYAWTLAGESETPSKKLTVTVEARQV